MTFSIVAPAGQPGRGEVFIRLSNKKRPIFALRHNREFPILYARFCTRCLHTNKGRFARPLLQMARRTEKDIFNFFFFSFVLNNYFCRLNLCRRG